MNTVELLDRLRAKGIHVEGVFSSEELTNFLETGCHPACATLRVFGGTLAIDPTRVRSVSIVDDPNNSTLFADAERATRADIISIDGRVAASTMAGLELIAHLRASVDASPVSRLPAAAEPSS